MRIIGLVGSPRKKMNTDVLVQAILDGCKGRGAYTEKIYLNNLNIQPCQACRVQDGNGCRLRDDMDVVYRAFEEADGLVIGTPVYYTSVSSQVKLMIDRSYCLARPVTLSSGQTVYQTTVPKRKKGILVCVSGGSSPKHVWAAFEDYWANEVNLEITHRIFVSQTNEVGDHTTPKEPKDRKELLEQMTRYGEGLYEAIEEVAASK
jgi:multimeric flavodoxin WrbA